MLGAEGGRRGLVVGLSGCRLVAGATRCGAGVSVAIATATATVEAGD